MRGTVTKRGKAWRVRIDAGNDPVTGKRRQISRTVHGKKEDANAVLATLMLEVRAGDHTATRVLTVGAALERWYKLKSKDWAENTRDVTRWNLDRRILPVLGPIPLAKLRGYDLTTFYDQLRGDVDDKGEPTGLAPASIAKVHSILHRALALAVKEKLIPTNPAVDASPPKVERRQPSPASSEQCKAFMAAAAKVDPQWLTYLRMAVATGARRGELCGLRRDCVDLDAGTVTIRRVVRETKRGPQVAEYPKSDRSRRTITVAPRTRALLKEHMRDQAEAALRYGVRLDGRAFVFSNEPDCSKPWDPHAPTRRFGRLRKKLGMTGVRLHDIRHHAATELVSRGKDPVTVAGRLGQDTRTLLATYAAWVPARDADAADTMDDLMDGEETG